MAVIGESLVNERTGQVVLADLQRANTAWKSFSGLMLKSSISDQTGLLFQPAKGIHTHFMRFPIDLIFVDRSLRVTKIRAAMAPWRFDFTMAEGVIEVNAGIAAKRDIQVGDQLRPVSSAQEVTPDGR